MDLIATTGRGWLRPAPYPQEIGPASNVFGPFDDMPGPAEWLAWRRIDIVGNVIDVIRFAKPAGSTNRAARQYKEAALTVVHRGDIGQELKC
jgi:hypothetical protein